jgi:hypothetical protein
MYCPKCATKNIEEAKYCQECGNKLQTTSTSVSDGLIKTVEGVNHPDTRALMTLGGSGVNVGMYGGGKKPLLTIHFNKEQTLEFKEMKELIESKMRKYH